ncbi:hypothetical protein B0T17DRAFT_496706 [Bombardia bombarda]|uniref:Uncharacterized protein n=1 Tax=Bombardia bombarda TaxID=252184 RepID=A0AA39WIK0_9PEZI|nr:hypothetical protein B0T17DRAFT_496706 [Bombardia bombarda]
MVQGGVKKNATPNPGKTKPGGRQQTRGALSKAKVNKTKADLLKKKFTGGMAAKTEKMLGERAGHLELIGQGRKKGAKTEEDRAKLAKASSASRKFG